MLRRTLDGLYAAALWTAALAMVGLLGMVLLSIVGRQAGFHLPGTDAYAGYLMAAAGFLALAGTFRRGEHIRVTLLLSSLGPVARHRLELWALGATSALALLGAWYASRLVWQSWQFNDISTGNDATPLWIPQLAMAAGSWVLAIALADDWVQEWRGRRPASVTGEAARHE